MNGHAAVVEVQSPVLIFGASGRAAAASAQRSGYLPVVVDQFADADTCEVATATRCPLDEYPDGIVALAANIPAMPFVYAGALENRPDVIERLALTRVLWGNPAAVLELVRDPFRLRDWFADAAIEFPKTVREVERPSTGRWLRKPRASGGGHGIAFASNGVQQSTNHVVQEYRAGEPRSAIFASDGRTLELLGITHQLIGQTWLHCQQFHYCGTLGPDESDDKLGPDLLRIADVLVERSGLRGIWGIDFLDDAGRIVVLEVNPRYTASIEVLEHQTGLRSFDWIRWAFAGGPKPLGTRAPKPGVVGKAIYFAPNDLTFPQTGPWVESLRRAREVHRRGDFADIPHPGEIIPRGFPVLTILDDAETRAECATRLQSRAAALDLLFSSASNETVP